MSTSYERDIELGKKAEAEFPGIVKKIFGVDIEHTKKKRHFADFRYKDIYIELKRRRGKHNRKPDALFNFKKITAFNEKDSERFKIFVFVFWFDDKMIIYEHRRGMERFYKIKDYCRKKRTGWDDKPEPMVFIPIKHCREFREMKKYFPIDHKKVLLKSKTSSSFSPGS